MTSSLGNVSEALVRRRAWLTFSPAWLSLSLTGGVALVGTVAFLLHFNLSAMGSIFLVLVVLVSNQWGLAQATVASVAAVICMNFLFIPPIFELQVADPQNWISLATFETAALVVSGLSRKVMLHAEHAEQQRRRTATLYDLSRAILLIEGRSSTGEQLAALVREIVRVDLVEFWVAYDTAQPNYTSPEAHAEDSAHATFLSGREGDAAATRTTWRLLRIGTTPIGAMVLRGWDHDSALADAVASLAAIAFERSRALQKESRAEAERNTEQLRTAVLDGLAHGFKTPLTAIQTASSGLLSLDHLTATQAELVSIIDEQAVMLSSMTTRLLQTAAMESRNIRLQRVRTDLEPLIEELIGELPEPVRVRVRLSAQAGITSIAVDRELVRLALVQLIDNAAKYSVVGALIAMTLQQDELETRVSVTSEGTPIQPGEQERIFERFYRGQNAAHGPSGTGVGLSIVKKTAEAHGGRAWVECEGKTTRFCFTMETYRGG